MSKRTPAPELVIEFHYDDGSVVRQFPSPIVAPWSEFSSKIDKIPSHIILRPATKKGYHLSEVLHNAKDAVQVCRTLVNALEENGGAVDWSVIADIYEDARNVIRNICSIDEPSP